LEPKDLLSNWLAFGVDWVASDDDAPKVFHFPQGLFVSLKSLQKRYKELQSIRYCPFS